MFERLPVRLTYTRAEYLSDAVVHVVGVVAVAAAVPALIVTAILTDGESGRVAGAAVYGATFVLMILCSALYNLIPHPDWEWLLKRLDHSAIYLKIAGTFTAFALIAGHGWWLISGLWAAAGAGVSLKLYAPERFKGLSLCLYLGMGWFGAVLGWSLFASLPVAVVALIASGGGLYTAGVMFYLWNRLPHHMAIWHVFVLTASLTIYAAIMLAVLS
ncbi:MAG: hemolysin III family protein [Paracoccaceae bacterium]|nr:hemolysin III family protein [Paracoccaceae bacterium]